MTNKAWDHRAAERLKDQIGLYICLIAWGWADGLNHPSAGKYKIFKY